MDIPRFEDHSLTVLRRKFLVAIPTLSIVGFGGARFAASKFGFTRWPRRGLCTLGAIVTPIIGSMLLVHLNKAEIFRVGSGMMREMEQLRKLEQGPFGDPNVRMKWDEQVRTRQFNLLRPDENIAQEVQSSVAYKSIVNDSIRK
jgi:hypothetical protein